MLNIQSYLPFVSSHKMKQNKDKSPSNITRVTSACGSTLGISAALSLLIKHRTNCSGSFLKNAISVHKIFKTFKDLECKEKDVLVLATGAITGGFLGGSVSDTKHIKQKTKEAVTQLIGNYVVPTLLVGAGVKIANLLNPVLNAKTLSCAKGFAGLVGLYYGVVFGNKISNNINKNIFNDKDKVRKLCWKDWSVQVDNVCLVTSLATNGTNIAKTASKVIPA